MITEEPPIVVLIVFFIVAICCCCHSCGRIDMEKQAINRGYATYNQQGEFTWKSRNE